MADQDDVIFEDDEHSSMSRWVPTLVVGIAFGGFIALAWYAYHTGTQSVNEEELIVVEADKSPMKEKPLDPGGMKFMNQDKTIYDTFSPNQQMPSKVEHVLPPPEEPIKKPTVGSAETKTWINEKLHNSEQVAVDEKPKALVSSQAVKPVDKPRIEQDNGITTHIAAAEKPVEQAKPAPADKKPDTAKPASGGTRIQLGAYGSDQEARNAWEKIQKKFPELADKTVYVVKADLGAKGVYHRLRVGGFSDVAAAKAQCAKLTAKGQACLVP